MSDLIWQEPPPNVLAGDKRHGWAVEAAELREHPKRWALLKTCDTARAAATFKSTARAGVKKAFRPVDEWEWRTDGPEVYVRFVGSGSAGGAA